MRRIVVGVFILLCLLGRTAGAEEKAIPHFLTEEYSGGARPELNVVLVHGLFSNRDLWTRWVDMAKKNNLPYRVWTYRYNWDNIAETAARNLAADMLAQRAKFEDRPLVLVGHSKGGLVSKAFAWMLTHPGGDFPTAAALGVRPDNLRIVYLDVPHKGGNFVNNPFLRLLVSMFGALVQGEVFGNLGAAEELSRGYGHDPGDVIPSYQFVLARNSKD
ncbi:MAG: alpha/beta hydrolase, partial [Armatimonadetes bacterium]|nr:alpha/beta hydrolase [Armatimonadota bacterium]